MSWAGNEFLRTQESTMSCHSIVPFPPALIFFLVIVLSITNMSGVVTNVALVKERDLKSMEMVQWPLRWSH